MPLTISLSSESSSVASSGDDSDVEVREVICISDSEPELQQSCECVAAGIWRSCTVCRGCQSCCSCRVPLGPENADLDLHLSNSDRSDSDNDYSPSVISGISEISGCSDCSDTSSSHWGYADLPLIEQLRERERAEMALENTSESSDSASESGLSSSSTNT